MRKGGLIFVIMALTMFFVTNPTYALGKTVLSVGLDYGTINDESITLKTEGDLSFGMMYNLDYVDIIDFASINEVDIIKSKTFEDGVLEGLNESYVNFGGYHIQIGGEYPTYENMKPQLDAINNKNINAYPAYSNGWKIFYGSYITQEKANSDISMIKNVVNDQTINITPVVENTFQVISKNKVILVFSGKETTFAFSSKDKENGWIDYNGREYREFIGINSFEESDPTVINYVDIENYLRGVVPKEMPGSWPIEALKAQAVAARNYAIASSGKHGEYGFDVCDTTDCQVYGGKSSEYENSDIAVAQTDGIVLKYNDEIVQAFFHANSGGQTASIENVWTSKIPYLRSVEDEFSLEGNNAYWQKSYTHSDITKILMEKGVDIGELKDISVIDYSESGRTMETVIVGSNGTETYKKENIRRIFGYSELKSTKFEVSTDNNVTVMTAEGLKTKSISSFLVMGAESIGPVKMDTIYQLNGADSNRLLSSTPSIYTFSGNGYGHGIGMSQWGAKKMADLGYSYVDILTYYYTGTHIE